MKQPASTETALGISTVSKLTGISQHLLRMWERRYEVVVTKRSSTGRRLYIMQDVDRLSLVKQLVSAGEAISKVAALDDAALKSQLDALEQSVLTGQERRGDKSIKVAMLGEVLSARLSELAEIPAALDVVVNTSSIGRFRTEIRKLQPSALIIESPLINRESRKLIRSMIDESGATRIVVIYQIGRRAEIDLLRPQGVRLVRASSSLEEVFDLLTLSPALEKNAVGLASPILPLDQSTEITPRRFNEQELVRLGLVESSVVCECPHHLVYLLNGLNAFEQYSMNCESENDDDAALHAYLYSVAALPAPLSKTLQNVLFQKKIYSESQIVKARRALQIG